jgi:hypothetical protein
VRIGLHGIILTCVYFLHNNFICFVPKRYSFVREIEQVCLKPFGRRAMTDLGLWTPFVDMAEMIGWYQLPALLEAEYSSYMPDGHELEALPAHRFAAVRQAAIAYAEASVEALALPYHNAQHFRLTEERGMAAAEAYEQLTGNEVPEAVKQQLALALRLHDCHHCGSTFRAQAPQPGRLWRPELGARVSAEWVSALAADALGRECGLSVPARLFQTMIIWASTYGGSAPLGQELGIPSPNPRSLWGCLMRAADVCPSPNPVDTVRASIAVNYGERPAIPPATSWDGFVAEQLAFTGYVELCFDRLDTVSGVELTAALGWRLHLSDLRATLGRLGEREPQLLRIVKAELARYGTQLS